jgi:hypothetical protein
MFLLYFTDEKKLFTTVSISEVQVVIVHGNSLMLNLSSPISCQRGSPRPRMMLAERHGSPNSHQMDAHHELHHHASAATTGSNADDNLHTFREALAFSSESLFVGNFCLFLNS